MGDATVSAAGDLDADGTNELVVIATGGGASISRPEDGEAPFLYSSMHAHALVLADISGDDTLDIIRTISGSGFLVTNHRGELKAQFDINLLRSVLPIDVTGDQRPELVTTTTTSVTVYNPQGQSLQGYPSTLASSTLARVLPFEADDDPKSEFLVFSSNQIYLFNDSARIHPNFPLVIGPSILSSPIIVDIDRDGKEDIVFAHQNTNNKVSTLHCVDRTGQSLSGWPRTIPGDYHAQVLTYPPMSSPGLESVAFPSTPALLAASVDGNLDPELIVLGANGMLTIFRSDGSILDGYPIFTGGRAADVPMMGDFDNDGAIQLVYRAYQEHPMRHTFVDVEFPPGSYNPLAIPWPMYMANAQRTGKGVPTVPVGVHDDETPERPTAFSLAPNYPNPFNPSTTIEYSLPREVRVSVRVFNMLGQCVATLVDGVQPAGTHRSLFTAEDVPSGVYIVSVVAGSDRASHKILLMK
jgi:hypothetical protein